MTHKIYENKNVRCKDCVFCTEAYGHKAMFMTAPTQTVNVCMEKAPGYVTHINENDLPCVNMRCKEGAKCDLVPKTYPKFAHGMGKKIDHSVFVPIQDENIREEEKYVIISSPLGSGGAPLGLGERKFKMDRSGSTNPPQKAPYTLRGRKSIEIGRLN